MTKKKQWKLGDPLYALGLELRRDHCDEYSIILALLRNNIDSFEQLHSRCKHAPSEVLKLRGIGPVSQPMVCKLCQKYAGVSMDDCSNDKALAPANTLLGLQQRAKLKPYVYRIVSPVCSTLEDVHEKCKGDPEKFGELCKDMSAKGMQELCLLCEKHLDSCDRCCPYILERDDAEHESVPSVYINNVMRAFGASYEDALQALRYGTSGR